MVFKGFSILISLLVIVPFNHVHEYVLFIDLEGLLSYCLLNEF